jgi:hypothetical protein
MKKLKLMNYWIKKVKIKFPRSAQAILRPSTIYSQALSGDTGCGQGSCNCGGGCNGECATSCES